MFQAIQEKRKKVFELVLVASNHMVDLLTSLLITKLISVYLTKDQYGFYALIISVFTFISIFPFTSLHTAIERKIVELNNNNTYGRYSIYFILYHLVFVALYLLFTPIIYANVSMEWKNLYVLIFAFIFTKLYKSLFICILNVERKRYYILIMRILDLAIQVAVVLFFSIRGTLKVEDVLLSSIIGSLCCFLVFFVAEKSRYLKFYFNFDDFIKLFRNLINFSLPFIIWGIFIWLQNMANRWYIDMFLAKSDVANFSIMTSLALLPASTIIAVVGQYFAPIAYQKESQENGYIAKLNKKFILYSCLFWLIAIIITYVVKDYLIVLLLDKKYTDVSWTLPILMIGTAIYATGQITIYEIYHYKKPGLLLLSNILPGLFTLIAGYFLIQTFGFEGSILVNVASFSLSGIITLITVARFTRQKNRLQIFN